MKSHSWIVQKVLSRLHNKNQNWICVICGPTGTGKSYSAMRLGELIDPNFSIDKICFNPREFLQLLNDGNLKTGACVILDEAGIGIPARQWHDICNKSIGYVLQAFRRENIALIMTTPSMSMVDVQARLLSHCFIETQKIDRKNKRVRVKIKVSQLNPEMGKIYRKYYRKGKRKIRHTTVEKPSKELIKVYENKKKEFSKSLYKGAMKDITKIQGEITTVQDIAKEILKNPEPYLKDYAGKKIADMDKIGLDYNIGRLKARKVRILVERSHKNLTQAPQF